MLIQWHFTILESHIQVNNIIIEEDVVALTPFIIWWNSIYVLLQWNNTHSVVDICCHNSD